MLIRFYMAHTTEIWLLAAYLFSGAMSTMPPLPDGCGYFVRWAHDWLQFLAANWNKYQTQRQHPAAIAVVVPGKE